MSLEVTATTGPLAEAAVRVARLLPTRTLQPAQAAVLVRAEAHRLVLLAADGEVTAEVAVAAVGHTPGEVVVSRRALAETLASLDAPELRLAVEGSRLAVRTSGARFALPALGDVARPTPAPVPPRVGTVTGAALAGAAAVCGAASRDGALPMFTAVRIRSAGDRLSLIATNRYRLAAARLAVTAPAGAVTALVPAALLGEVCRQAGRTEAVGVHADASRFGLSWGGCTVVTASLAGPFPDQQLDRLLEIASECTVEVAADALAAAADRAQPYAGPHGRVTLALRDGAVEVRSRDPLHGESEETVKAAVRGDHLTVRFQSRYLIDALRPFTGLTVTMRVQAGLRATAFTAPDTDLTYLVVPMRADD
jgi:DNA polymerase-3 subunit beta